MGIRLDRYLVIGPALTADNIARSFCTAFVLQTGPRSLVIVERSDWLSRQFDAEICTESEGRRDDFDPVRRRTWLSFSPSPRIIGFGRWRRCSTPTGR